MYVLASDTAIIKYVYIYGIYYTYYTNVTTIKSKYEATSFIMWLIYHASYLLQQWHTNGQREQSFWMLPSVTANTPILYLCIYIYSSAKDLL